jgi:hypothetical protein
VNSASLRPHLKFWGLRAAWLLAVALWALALVPWFKAPTPTPPSSSPSTPRSVAADVAVPTPAASEPSEPLYVAQRQRPPAFEPAAPTLEREPADSVCGMPQTASAASDATTSRTAYLARQTQLGLLQAVDALRARGEPIAQGAGLWLRVLLAREGAGSDPLAAPCSGSDCPSTVVPALPSLPAAIESLAQLAQASADAWLQQIAQRACGFAPPTSALCTQLGARRWSAQEPDNAAAWLELANRDAQAVDEALDAAGRANRFDDHRGRLAAWVAQTLPDSVPLLQRHSAWQRAGELERASDAAALAAAARHCDDAARRNANRAQLCERAARWFGGEARPDAGSATANHALDCPTLDRQWREARDSAQRATSGTTTRAQPTPSRDVAAQGNSTRRP